MSRYDDIDSPDYNDNNLYDPRETPEEKQIAKLERELSAAVAERDLYYARCASLIFSDELKDTLNTTVQQWQKEYVDAKAELSALRANKWCSWCKTNTHDGSECGEARPAPTYECPLHYPMWCSCPEPKDEKAESGKISARLQQDYVELVCDGSRQIIEPNPLSNAPTAAALADRIQSLREHQDDDILQLGPDDWDLLIGLLRGAAQEPKA